MSPKLSVALIFSLLLFTSIEAGASAQPAESCADKVVESGNIPKAIMDCLLQVERENQRLSKELSGLSANTPSDLDERIQTAIRNMRPAATSIQSGSVLKMSYASGNGPNDDTDHGLIDSRILRFKKIEDESEIRIAYHDNTRVSGNSAACRWTLEVNGTDCNGQSLYVDRHDGSSTNIHSPSTLVGYCQGLKADWYTIRVWVSPVPTGDDRFKNSNCYTGWDNSHWTLEAVELYPTHHQQ